MKHFNFARKEGEWAQLKLKTKTSTSHCTLFTAGMALT